MTEAAAISLNQTVFVVDDDEAIRDALSILVETVGLSVRNFASAAAFLDEYDSEPGVLLLDVRMPGMSGLELQTELVERKIPGLSVLFMSGHSDIPVAVEALKRGAADFLQKPFRDQELLDHIHLAMENNVEKLTAASKIKEVRDRLESLTPREQQVMEMISDGKANKIIALDLGISQRTVELHRSARYGLKWVCALWPIWFGRWSERALLRGLERRNLCFLYRTL